MTAAQISSTIGDLQPAHYLSHANLTGSLTDPNAPGSVACLHGHQCMLQDSKHLVALAPARPPIYCYNLASVT